MSDTEKEKLNDRLMNGFGSSAGRKARVDAYADLCAAANEILLLRAKLKTIEKREVALINRISDFVSGSGFSMRKEIAGAITERFINMGGRHD